MPDVRPLPKVRFLPSSSVMLMLAAAALIGCQRPGLPSETGAPASVSETPAPTLTSTPGVASAQASLTDTSRILRVGGAVTEPVAISQVQPDLPERYRRVRITQPVYIFEAVITESGTVERLRLLRGRTDKEPYISYERSAREAISQWRYRPAMLHGRPVPVWLTVTASVEVR